MQLLLLLPSVPAVSSPSSAATILLLRLLLLLFVASADLQPASANEALAEHQARPVWPWRHSARTERGSRERRVEREKKGRKMGFRDVF